LYFIFDVKINIKINKRTKIKHFYKYLHALKVIFKIENIVLIKLVSIFRFLAKNMVNLVDIIVMAYNI